MNTKQLLNIVQHHARKISLGIAGFALSIGVLSYGIYSPISQNEDILMAILEVEKNNFKADFFTDELYPYTGPTSSTIEACIRSSTSSANRGSVYATVDIEEFTKIILERRNQKLSIEDIRDDIMPIFGMSMLKQEINWKWDRDLLQYEFFTYPGEENFWGCYFNSSDTEFFPRFFKNIWYDYQYSILPEVPSYQPLSTGEIQ